MTYTQLAITAVVIAVAFDLFLFRTQLLKRKAFWVAYSIILAFQLLTNWWLTSRNIVMYSSETIIGVRIAAAPIEDLLFGFALVLSVLTNWIRLGVSDKRG